MIQHQGQHPPEDRKKEGEGEKGGAGEDEPSGRREEPALGRNRLCSTPEEFQLELQ